MTLSSIFQACRGGGPAAPGAEPDALLEAALQRLLQTAEGAHPEPGLAPEAFVRYVAERLPVDAEPVSALAALHAADLYLACGCVAGNAQALAVLEERLLAPLASQLEREAAGLADEALQILRTRVLVRDSAADPKIANYDGHGPLSAWLRVTAARITLELRKSQQARGRREGIADALPLTTDPELSFLKTHYRQELADAFRATVAALPARDANVLRLHYLEQSSPQAIAGLYQVSIRTVQHWLTQARRHILAETRRALGERLRLSDAETDSVMGLARSQLDITLQTILQKP